MKPAAADHLSALLRSESPTIRTPTVPCNLRCLRCCPPKQKGRRCGPCPCRGICREDFPETTAQSSAQINSQTIARVRYLPSESSDTAALAQLAAGHACEAESSLFAIPHGSAAALWISCEKRADTFSYRTTFGVMLYEMYAIVGVSTEDRGGPSQSPLIRNKADGRPLLLRVYRRRGIGPSNCDLEDHSGEQNETTSVNAARSYR
jgi:hypothetical protein